MGITPNSKIPFGNICKNRRIKDCPNDYLAWCAKTLLDTDFHEYALAAKQELDDRSKDGSLEEQAEAFLRRHGVDPDQYSDRPRRR